MMHCADVVQDIFRALGLPGADRVGMEPAAVGPSERGSAIELTTPVDLEQETPVPEPPAMAPRPRRRKRRQPVLIGSDGSGPVVDPAL